MGKSNIWGDSSYKFPYIDEMHQLNGLRNSVNSKEICKDNCILLVHIKLLEKENKTVKWSQARPLKKNSLQRNRNKMILDLSMKTMETKR